MQRIRLALAGALALLSLAATAAPSSVADIPLFPGAVEAPAPEHWNTGDEDDSGGPFKRLGREQKHYLVTGASPEEVFRFYQDRFNSKEQYDDTDVDFRSLEVGQSTKVIGPRYEHYFRPEIDPHDAEKEMPASKKLNLIKGARQPMPDGTWINSAHFSWMTRIDRRQLVECGIALEDDGLPRDWSRYSHRVLLHLQCDRLRPQSRW